MKKSEEALVLKLMSASICPSLMAIRPSKSSCWIQSSPNLVTAGVYSMPVGVNSTLSDSFQRRRSSGVRLLGLLPPAVALGDDVRQVFGGELTTG